MSENQIVKVAFHGGDIEAVKQGEDVFVSIRRACEHLGIDYNGQQQKLRDESRAPWARACVMHVPDSRGTNQEAFMLHLDSVPMWLATIDAGRVNEEARPLLIAYQKEAARVLRDHFFKKTELTTLQILDMARESEIKRLAAEKEIKKLSPYAEVGKAFAEREGAAKIGQFAKCIRVDGRVMGQRKMFEFLREIGFISPSPKNEPYQYHVDAGRAYLAQGEHSENNVMVTHFTPMLTIKGQCYIVTKLQDHPFFLNKSIIVNSRVMNIVPLT